MLLYALTRYVYCVLPATLESVHVVTPAPTVPICAYAPLHVFPSILNPLSLLELSVPFSEPEFADAAEATMPHGPFGSVVAFPVAAGAAVGAAPGVVTRLDSLKLEFPLALYAWTRYWYAVPAAAAESQKLVPFTPQFASA